MYSFLDRSGDSMTLRPEATAAVVRAYIQHGLKSRPQPVKVYLLLSAFRYDKPQAGRYREFHQFDAEAIGEADALVDADLVALQWRFYRALGLERLSLHLNSIGDQACRSGYIQALREYLERHEAGLCEDCRRRVRTNPLRVLDDKNPQCQPILDAAPRSQDYLCGACREHFDDWLGYLDAAGVPYTVTPRLVRGLDYYTRSVWEVWPPNEGAQSTLGGGGRYDGLAEQLGGPPTPGVGFATGIERLILELKAQNAAVPPSPKPAVFVAYQAGPAKRHAFALAATLRQQGFATDLAYGSRRLGKQLGAADRSGAEVALIIGDDELASRSVTVKVLRQGGEQRTVPEAELAAVLREVVA
jgi:histidyl-tRNA synthetase